MTKTEIKELLEKYRIKPNKRMGQSFLIDKNILDKIIETAHISKDNIILEIGSGLGNLTKRLAQKAKKVIAIEKDKKLIEPLKNTLREYDNVEIIQGDILKNELKLPLNYKIIANIPYYLTSSLIRKFLESENQPQEMTLLIQKEVAQRMTTKPPRMNLLSISVQFYAQPEITFHVSKNCFWPKPKVDSALIKMSEIKKPKGVDIERFFQLVKVGFSSPRKQLVNNLSSKLGLDRGGIKKTLIDIGLDEKIRAEGLRIEDWVKLSSKL